MQHWLRRSGLMSAWCVAASFGAYACMYGLRKPFTAGTYLDEPFGHGFKAWLVMAQVLGYTVSKFVGIRVIATLHPRYRIAALLGLLAVAEIALVLFAVTPRPWKVACLFLNGLPLGMVFGLVLGFLEGRRMTEAFVAGLCASFILADGVAKTVGSELLARGVAERWMPATAGLLFLAPLVGFVVMLACIPPPTAEDVAARSERTPMSREDRSRWLRRQGLGLGAVVLAYLMITVLRGMRADFAPELWHALGVEDQPDIFTRSEVWVALGVVAANGAIVVVKDNRKALSLALITGLVGLAVVALALTVQAAGGLPAFGFMVLLGLGLYLPYVAVHTTVFERLIALTRDRANLGYLMYLADATGYLGYVGVMLGGKSLTAGSDFLDFFRTTAWLVTILAALGFATAWYHFAGQNVPSRLPEQAPC